MDDSDILGSFLLNFGAFSAFYEYAKNVILSELPWYKNNLAYLKVREYWVAVPQHSIYREVQIDGM
jgi:hypothetical protein